MRVVTSPSITATNQLLYQRLDTRLGRPVFGAIYQKISIFIGLNLVVGGLAIEDNGKDVPRRCLSDQKVAVILSAALGKQALCLQPRQVSGLYWRPARVSIPGGDTGRSQRGPTGHGMAVSGRLLRQVVVKKIALVFRRNLSGRDVQ